MCVLIANTAFFRSGSPWSNASIASGTRVSVRPTMATASFSFMPNINAAVRPPRKISRTQYHRRSFFTDRLIRFDRLYRRNDHKAFDLLVQAKLERLKLLRWIIFTAADHGSVAVAVAHFTDPGHGLCSDLIAQGVHDHTDDPALSGLERSGNAAGHIVILPDHLFIIKQKLLPDTKK